MTSRSLLEMAGGRPSRHCPQSRPRDGLEARDCQRLAEQSRPGLHPRRNAAGLRTNLRRRRARHQHRQGDEGICPPGHRGAESGRPQSRDRNHACSSPPTNTNTVADGRHRFRRAAGRDLQHRRTQPGVLESHRQCGPRNPRCRPGCEHGRDHDQHRTRRRHRRHSHPRQRLRDPGRRISPKSTIPSSPPRKSAAAPVRDSRSPIPSWSTSTAGTSTSRARSASARHSCCGFPSPGAPPRGRMKNIVFVDDERELLDGLRARLYKHRNDWNMQFVVSGDEAIAIFEKEPVDLIVSDVRMPGMDGGQLLTAGQAALADDHAHHRLRLFRSRSSRAAHLARASVSSPSPATTARSRTSSSAAFNLQALLARNRCATSWAASASSRRCPRPTRGCRRRSRSRRSPPPRSATSSTPMPPSPARCCRSPTPPSSDYASPWCASRMRSPISALRRSATSCCPQRSSPNGRPPRVLPEVDPDRLQNHAQYSAAACKALAGWPRVRR